MDERTFKEYLEDTTISRYKQADAVFSQVQEALSKLAAGAETAKAEELRLAVNKIDEAIALMSYGAYGWIRLHTESLAPFFGLVEQMRTRENRHSSDRWRIGVPTGCFSDTQSHLPHRRFRKERALRDEFSVEGSVFM